MKRLQKGVIFGLALVFTLLAGASAPGQYAQAMNAGTLEHTVKRVDVDGKKITVEAVSADLTDPYIGVEAVAAEGGIGSTEPFTHMMERTGAAAGINGTFFNAFEENAEFRVPYGILLNASDLYFAGDKDIAITVDVDKAAKIRRLNLYGTVQIGSEFRLAIGGTNTRNEDRNDAFGYLYTRDYGDQVDLPGIKIAADASGKVVAITDQAAVIPQNGKVLLLANRDRYWSLIPQIRLGDIMNLEMAVSDPSTKQGVPMESLLMAIGAGPKLVSGGAVDLDYVRDKFNDPLVTSKPNVRSFAGVDGSGRLVIGTLSYCTLEEGAQALVQLGLQEAMNLDGGASSAFFADGQVKRPAGRMLSNALVIKSYELPQVQVAVNGKLLAGTRGYVRDGVTLVPFRALLNRLQADYSWDQASSSLSVTKDGLNLVLKPGYDYALVNGRAHSMDTTAEIVDGHLYVPLRFAAETFGAKVEWDQSLYRASITLTGK